jgi:aminopeptidase N
MARRDPHSYADDAQPRTKAVDWNVTIDFERRALSGTATLRFHETTASAVTLDLDTRDLTILSACDDSGRSVEFVLHPAEPILGARLTLRLQPGTSSVTVTYATGTSASALQWLTPEQTRGGRHPYLFTQCQAIHARSLLPCQDSPAFRFVYAARLRVPVALRAVMAAASVGRTEDGGFAVESFEMPQSIPPYLLAFAVGNLASRELSQRSRVWAEPETVESAAWEFADVEKMMQAAESLFGPYDWDRFDLLVMPPSFPYGGMENPRLTFLTPSLLAGDRSLVDVVVHELAHAWTGNLVTNANAEHFWLNEGFTVFAERRILEALEGEAIASLSEAIGFHSLEEALRGFSAEPELTKLRTQLTGIDPDEAFSVVPYEKGYLFLKTIEAEVGRSAFEALLRRWLSTHRFGSVTTEDFIKLVDEMLPGVLEKVGANRWIDGPGLPDNAPHVTSTRRDAVERAVGRAPENDVAKHWTPAEWQLYLDLTPKPSSVALCEKLDREFALSRSTNFEILIAWLVLACSSGYDPVLPIVERVLGEVGRAKYLKPLYRTLAMNPKTRELGATLFAKFAPRYHPIAQHMVSAMLERLNRPSPAV